MLGIISTLSIIFIFAIQKKLSSAISLFLLLLPIHGFIKYYLDYKQQGGEVFSSWKEIVILFLLLKILFGHYKTLLSTKVKTILIIYFIINIIYVIFSFAPINLALTSLKNYSFPFILFYIVSCVHYNKKSIRSFFNILIIITIFINIMGLIEHFIYRDYFLNVLGGIDSYAGNGDIIYTSTSWTIGGFNRMFSIMGGGPNQFGTFNGICSSIFINIILSNKLNISKKWSITALIFSLMGLLFSLSRAGIAIFLVCSIISILQSNLQSNPKKAFSIGFIIISLLFLLFLIIRIKFPYISSILSDTINGKEASSAERSNNIIDGLSFIISHPLGFGMGTSNNNYSSNVYFAESSIINLGVEIGLIGVFIYFYLQLLLLNFLKRNKNTFSNIAFPLLIACLIASVFSVNPYQIPSNYYWWIFVGLGFNPSLKILSSSKIESSVYNTKLL